MINIEPQLKALSPRERAVLYYYAIEDYDNYSRTPKANFLSEFRMTDREMEKISSKLSQTNLVLRYGYYIYHQHINQEYRIAAIEYMLEHDPDMEGRMLNVFKGATDALNDFRILTYAIRGKGTIPKGKIKGDAVTMVAPYIDRPWLRNIVPYLADLDYVRLVSSVMYNHTLADILISRETLDDLCCASMHSPMIKQQIQDMQCYYLFTAYGDVTFDKAPTTRSPMTIAVEGIRKAIKGDYEGAIATFNLAFKILNRDTSLKNCFTELFAQYYLVMCYYHLADEKSLKKLQTFIKKKDTDGYSSLVPSRFMARLALNNKKLYRPDYIKEMVTAKVYGSTKNMVAEFGILFDKYFKTDIYKGTVPTPNYALMQFEMADVLDIDEERRVQIKGVYGGQPILTSIHRKENWELVIDEVLKTVEQTSPQLGTEAPVASTPTSRIIYVTQSRDKFEPRYQTVLKSGAWSKPRKVTLEKYYAGELDFMNDDDRIIANIMRPDYYGYSYDNYNSASAWAIMPYLIGSDCIFEINYTNDITRQIQVVEGTPLLKVAKDKVGRYEVTSNISRDALDHMTKGMVTLRTSPETYTVIPVSEHQKRIYQTLLAEPVFPAAAEPQLMKLLTRLDGVIEIKSPLLDKSAASTVSGSGLMVAKVKPLPGMMYDVSLLSKPLEHGTIYQLPGVGKNVYYDTVDGANVRVKRDMDAEMHSYRELLDVLDSEATPMADGDYNVTLEVEPLLQLIDFSRLNPQIAVIEWAQGKGISLRAPLSQGSWNVGIKAQNGWFDIEGEVRVDEHTVIKMTQLIELIAQEKGRFVRLGENDYIEIDRKLRRQLERIEALAVRSRNKLQVSAFNAALLDDSVLNGEIHIDHDDKLTELQQRISESANIQPKVPANLNARLRPYQEEGFQWMMRLAQWGAGACLADDMGLGKTVQTIAFLLAKAKEGPALIVAPASVVPNWRNEMERFAPSLNVEILNKADDRKGAIEKASKGDVLVTTYGLLNTEEEHLAQKKWATVCLDEAHTIKNRDTKMSQAAMRLQADYRIALTGTPIQNHLGELWNLFRFLNEGLLGPFDSFKQKFVNPITQNNDKDRRRALQRIIKPFMLRRTKAEVIDELPDKTDIYLPVELSDEEQAMYEALRKKAVAALEEATTLDVSTLAEITKLRRAACAPSLIDPDWTGANSKVQTFLELVRDFKGESNRMLVFSQFTSFLDIVRKALDEAGEKYLYLDGSTPIKQRERLVEEFQQGECPLFLISLKAGGLGLNLTGANYVVHLDPWWNPAIEQQATDRAYRIGQHRNVTVYHLLSKGTIEEKIQRLHQTKRDLADSLLEGTDMAARLTVKDILELVNS